MVTAPTPIPPRVIPLALFAQVDQALLSLLGSLRPEDWRRPTVCSEWTVKDIASHLLDGSLRRISLHRDGHAPRGAPTLDLQQQAGLVRYLNQLNADWTIATDRLSPRVLMDLLAIALPQSSEFLASLPPLDTARFAVGWAGEAVSRNWMDVARDYTERWHHQQQIAEAVGADSGILARDLYYPVLETFLRALPHTFRDTERPEGAVLRVSIVGPAGGDWRLVRSDRRWILTERAAREPAAIATLSDRSAWLMFTKKWNRATKLARFPDFQVTGDQELGFGVLDMVSIMA